MPTRGHTNAQISHARSSSKRTELRKLTVRAQRAHAQHRKLLDSDDDLAPHALRVAIEMDGDRDQLAESIRDAEKRLADWPVAPDIDAALDFYNELRDAVQGRIAHARSANELNVVLRDTLRGAWLSIHLDGRFVGRFVLRVSDATLAGKLPEELVVGLDLHLPRRRLRQLRTSYLREPFRTDERSADPGPRAMGLG